MSGTASGWTPVGPAGGGRWELLVFCCIWLGLRARCAGIGTGKESGRMVLKEYTSHKKVKGHYKVQQTLKTPTVYTIYFSYFIFSRFWTRWGNSRWLNFTIFVMFSLLLNSHILKWKFSRGLTREIRENKTTANITTLVLQSFM